MDKKADGGIVIHKVFYRGKDCFGMPAFTVEVNQGTYIAALEEQWDIRLQHRVVAGKLELEPCFKIKRDIFLIKNPVRREEIIPLIKGMVSGSPKAIHEIIVRAQWRKEAPFRFFC